MAYRMKSVKASVIVLSYNGAAYLSDCLQAVLQQDYPDFEVIVVDNASTDGSAELVAEQFPMVRLIRNTRNLGFGGGNNVGLRAAKGDILVLLNQDTVVHTGWLAAVATALADPTIGIVGCKMLYPDGTIQHAGAAVQGERGESIHLGQHEPDHGQYDQPQDVDFVTGAAVAMTRSTFAQVGPLDEGFYPAYHEDVDWCYRVRSAGLRIVYWPAASLTHRESTSVEAGSYDHMVTYHYTRLRLLFKHSPFDKLQADFEPAERSWLESLGHSLERQAVRQAYLNLVFSMPEVIKFQRQSHQISEVDTEALINLALALRTTSIPTPVVPVFSAGQDEAQVVVDQESDEFWPPELWQALQGAWEIKERPFQSDLPVIGPAIAAFRRVWNNISTRWYVLPILAQQIHFNATATQVLLQLRQYQANFEQDGREIDRLTQEIVRLRQQLEQLDEQN